MAADESVVSDVARTALYNWVRSALPGRLGQNWAIVRREWSRRWDSNPRPSVYETDALPLSYFGACASADSSPIPRAAKPERLSAADEGLAAVRADGIGVADRLAAARTGALLIHALRTPHPACRSDTDRQSPVQRRLRSLSPDTEQKEVTHGS